VIGLYTAVLLRTGGRRVHGLVLNLFRLGRHLLRAVHYRLFRGRAFEVWREVTCV